VLPRYTIEGGSPIWPDWTGKVANVKVKVLRSGRRNMLKSTVQQATLAANPYQSSINDLLGGSSAFNKILSLSGTIYSQRSGKYSKDEVPDSGYFMALVIIPPGGGGGSGGGNDSSLNEDGNFHEELIRSSGNWSGFNSYVMGQLGNYRPRETYNAVDP